LASDKEEELESLIVVDAGPPTIQPAVFSKTPIQSFTGGDYQLADATRALEQSIFFTGYAYWPLRNLKTGELCGRAWLRPALIFSREPA